MDPLAHVDAERAASAFGVLSDPVRVDILRALRRHDTATFSTLQEAVGVTDSGRFNYHLDKLTDHFIRQTDDGYVLQMAGVRALNIAASGCFTVTPSVDPVALDADCPECGSGLEAAYEDGWFRIGCPDCGIFPHIATFPPHGVPQRDTGTFLRDYSAWIRRQYSLAAEGVCPFCGGTMVRSLDLDPAWFLGVAARTDCESCAAHVETPVGFRLLDHPAVAGFLYERGIDIDGRPFWQFEWCLSAADLTVEARDPARVVQTVRCDGDELRLTVDGSLAVAARERRLRG